MSSSPADTAPRASWPRSLTLRLTLIYTLITFIILAAAGGGLYWVLRNSLVRFDEHFLVGKVHVLRKVLATGAVDPDTLHEELDWEGGGSKHRRYYVRILTAGGRVYGATPAMATLPIPTAAFPAPEPVGDPPAPVRRWCVDGDRCYLLLSAWAPSQPATYRLQLVLDMSAEQALLGDYRNTLILALALATLAAALIGWVATRRGLRPLKDLMRTARNTSTFKLDQRIGPAGWPTELAALGAAFDAMLERLESGVNRISQFSADLAHELRTPINNLMGELGVALSRSREAAEYRQVLESNLEECARLGNMIDRLLFLVRAGEAMPQVERTTLNGGAEVAAVCEYFAALAEEQNLTLVYTGEATILAEPELLRRALGNIVSNALQYTPPGGHVDVTLEQTADNGASIRVADTGIGISEAQQARLFDRFYRSEAAREFHPQGSGLGLAIVRSIMALHGGGVTLAAGAAGGTIATLTFPPS